MPQNQTYGIWPTSGQIDFLDSKGNRRLRNSKNVNVGVQRVQSGLHFGAHNFTSSDHPIFVQKFSKSGHAWNNDFHIYEMEWTPSN